MEFCKACIPSRNGLIRENDKSWFTLEIRYNIRLRDRLRKHFFLNQEELLSFDTENNMKKIYKGKLYK